MRQGWQSRSQGGAPEPESETDRLIRMSLEMFGPIFDTGHEMRLLLSCCELIEIVKEEDHGVYMLPHGHYINIHESSLTKITKSIAQLHLHYRTIAAPIESKRIVIDSL